MEAFKQNVVYVFIVMSLAATEKPRNASFMLKSTKIHHHSIYSINRTLLHITYYLLTYLLTSNWPIVVLQMYIMSLYIL